MATAINPELLRKTALGTSEAQQRDYMALVAVLANRTGGRLVISRDELAEVTRDQFHDLTMYQDRENDTLVITTRKAQRKPDAPRPD